MIRKILSNILIFVLVLSSVLPSLAFAENESITLKVGIKDEFTTKSERITFDLWARTEDDEKIDDDYVSVTNNGNPVDINWSDQVKTSYTAYLEEGLNEINIVVDYNGEVIEKELLITYEYAEDGEIIGEFTFSMDGFVVGLDYLIEPVKIPIVKGENAAIHLERILADYGYESYYSGSPEGGYYLSSIYGGVLPEREPNIPDAIVEALDNYGAYIDDSDYDPIDNGLGEFDFNYLSGWMYAVNNEFPNVGFSDYYLMEEDVMRVQFTVAYGSDIGGGYALGNGEDNQFFERVSKDDLTEIMASINSASGVDYLKANANIADSYEHAMETIRTVDIDQESLNEATKQLTEAYKDEKINAFNYAIEQLPDEPTIKYRQQIQKMKWEYENLTANEKEQIINFEKLENIFSNYQQVIDAYNQSEAQKIIDLINTLPAVEDIQLSDLDLLKKVEEAFANLTDEQTVFVTNYNVLKEVRKQMNVLIKEDNKRKAQPYIDRINALPKLEDITLEHEELVLSLNTEVQRLSSAISSEITNRSILTSIVTKINSMNREISNEVTNLINKLPKASEVTLKHKVQIEELLRRYNALSKNQLSNITSSNKTKVKDVEKKLNDLIAAAKAKAKPVIEAISALPEIEHVLLQTEEKVNEITELLKAFSEEEKQFIENVSTFEAVKQQIDTLKQQVETVKNSIAALPTLEEITLSDDVVVKGVRASYEVLTTEQKAHVSNVEKLVSIEERLIELAKEAEQDQLDTEKANAISKAIEDLPSIEQITLLDEQLVTTIREQYELLTEAQKLKVVNVEKLEAIEKRLVELNNIATEEALNQSKALEVVKAIELLPQVEALTLQDEEVVQDVRKQYNALTEVQKQKVTNVEKLETLEKRLVELHNIANEKALDDSKASEVIKAIELLPQVEALTLQDEETLQNVRKQYNALTDAQKKLITNISILEQLEQKMFELQKEKQSISVGQNAVTKKFDEATIETTSNYLLKLLEENDSEKINVQNANGIEIQFTKQQLQALDPSTTLKINASIEEGKLALEFINAETSKQVETNTFVQVKVPLAQFEVDQVKTSVQLPRVFVQVMDGKNVSVPHKVDNGEVILYVKASGSYTSINHVKTFNDITKSFAKSDIEQLASRFVIFGTSDTTYAPKRSINRGEMALLMTRALNVVSTNENQFKDTKGTIYTEAVQAMKDAGLTSQTEFYYPTNAVTREEAASFMYNIITYVTGEKGKGQKELTYKDASKINAVHVEQVKYLTELNILQGDGVNFNPKGTLSREEMAAMLARTLRYLELM